MFISRFLIKYIHGELHDYALFCLLVVFDTLELNESSSRSSGITIDRYLLSNDSI